MVGRIIEIDWIIVWACVCVLLFKNSRFEAQMTRSWIVETGEIELIKATANRIAIDI